MIALMIFGGMILYVTASILITRNLVRRAPNTTAKWVIGLLSGLILLLIPTWDEIAGRIYLYKTCATESGVRVHKTVTLGPEYWDKDGKPTFVTSYQNKSTVIMKGQYKFVSEGYNPYSDTFNLRKYQLKLVNTESNEELGTYTKFAFGGGWLLNRVPAHYGAVICPSETLFTSELITAVFLRK